MAFRITWLLCVLGEACVLANENTVAVRGDAEHSYRQYLYSAGSKCPTTLRGLQFSPTLRESMLPDDVKTGSAVYDATTGLTWHHDGKSWSGSR